MDTILRTVLVCCLLAIISGCTSVTPVSPNSPAVILDTQQTRNYYGTTWMVTLPKGRYEPAFQTPQGSFYSAPTTLVIQAIGHTAVIGGIYLPRATNKDQRPGFYIAEGGPGSWIAIRQPLIYHFAP